MYTLGNNGRPSAPRHNSEILKQSMLSPQTIQSQGHTWTGRGQLSSTKMLCPKATLNDQWVNTDVLTGRTFQRVLRLCSSIDVHGVSWIVNAGFFLTACITRGSVLCTHPLKDRKRQAMSFSTELATGTHYNFLLLNYLHLVNLNYLQCLWVASGWPRKCHRWF